MADRLLIVALGNMDSGKSKTWDTLFGRTVKTGATLRFLYLKKPRGLITYFSSVVRLKSEGSLSKK